MIEDFIKKLLSILNKPTHYLFVGFFLLLYGKINNVSNFIIIGGCLFFFAIASFTDLICKFFYKKFQLWSRKRKINKAHEKYEKEVIEEYESLSNFEKHFIRSIVLNNKLVTYIYEFETHEEFNRVYSIKHRGWATFNTNDNLFIFDNKILKILQKYINNNKNFSGTLTRVTVTDVKKDFANEK